MVDPLSPYAPTPRRLRRHSVRDAILILLVGFAGLIGILDGSIWLVRSLWLLAVAVVS